MRLVDLKPRWLRWEKVFCGLETDNPRGFSIFHARAASLAEAHGIIFLCPKCFAVNGGPVGTHSVICWFEGRVPEEAEPAPGRWNPVPTDATFENLSFVPGAKPNSVLLIGGCAWHGFITNGEATLG